MSKNPQPQKTARASMDMENENLAKLREVFPEFVKDGVIDFDALQAFFKEEGALAGDEKYGLNWAGKSNAFKLIRPPATGTLAPAEDESKNWDETENLFLEGDNLEVLKLLQKHYREKVKMIYIDPPYNTGKDFIYKDNYAEDESDYYERTGQTDGGIKMTANPESAGRYHSDWLTMMYPRLFLGKNLLAEDGIIFVSIDDNEVHNLQHIMDRIFGEENFLTQITWKRKKESSNDSGGFAVKGEYILVYSKSAETEVKPLPLSDEYIASSYSEPTEEFPDGKWRPVPIATTKGHKSGGYKYKIKTPGGREVEREWAYPQESYENLLEEGRVYFGKNENSIPQRVVYAHEMEGVPPSNVWDDLTTNKEGKNELVELFGEAVFDTVKPTKLIKEMLRISTKTESEDIVIDFFAGSASTAHAVMKQNAEDGGNRKYIMVQLPEETDKDSEARKAGFETIADIAKERIRRAGEKIKEEYEEDLEDRDEPLDVGFKVLKLQQSNYRQWSVVTDDDDKETLLEQEKLFAEKPLVDKYNEEEVVYEILLKEGFNLSSSVSQAAFFEGGGGGPVVEGAKTKMKIKPGSGEEQKWGALETWIVEDEGRKLVITFADKVVKEQVEALDLSEEDIFVCFDSALDDTTKVNIMRNLNVKVI